ncbi:1-deoxy-D-xylulose-5-phosphate synthase [Chitinimonas arctica]|uniref:1-deoxy-D-xylulose-5-phosphate synthase n=1 Tax=Chitinimonas arctica TaxID=2594795 RepID=A0A516SI77_9NEIS|nr:1-deoxy-D-xylulose-5-phosphate synthase [Chitinimonas arctica]QDQ27846.1 1-deoxy-D-xylulose-5-phosphate synthase [Chitinimonas arctica]
MPFPLLDTVHLPADLRRLNENQLKPLAQELRAFLLESVSQSGGHFASNLGAVELTIALHYVFDTPNDRLVWDVGHQSYPHKILTGRRAQMHTMRKYGGLAGFPKREESEYDTFAVGHSSTSIGAAAGMAEASKLLGQQRKCVAIIGDGAMTAGMAFEALNNAGNKETDLLVVLNDNEMSISPNVGAFNSYLARLLSGKFYQGFRNTGSRVLENVPPLHELIRRGEEHMKGLISPSTLFEEFGFHYVGPIDGHDLDTLIPTLQNLRSLSGPQFLHVVTKKGQGYKLAEGDPVKYHAVTPFTPADGMASKAASKPSYTQIFGDWLCDMAAQDSRLIGITPAMREGSGLVRFEQSFPDRYYDVGIAEQHAVTFAAGMACEGLKPVVAIYSTFLQRAYDQLIHDVALQNLPVLFAIDRAGLVGADGPTHAGSFDISYLRCIPNMAVLCPADENECRQMLYTAYQMDQPTAVRYPRGTGPGVPLAEAFTALPVGRGEVRRQGRRIAILAFGSMVAPSLAAAEALDATVANMRWVKPLDVELVLQLAADHDVLVTVEENAVMGGAGSAVIEALHAAGVLKPVLQLGLPDRYVDHGDPALLLAECGLDAAGIEAAARAFDQKNTRH